MRAPELVGRGWLNTDGAAYSVADFRGRFVLLDFWTFCCINCLHVIEELRELEGEYAAELVVVGVHSPKFVHEADPDALAAAVERHRVHHPVLDDPDLVTWQAYTARAWPTLVLVDPEGYVVAQYAGEGHAHALAALLAELVPEHRERGTLRPGRPLVPTAETSEREPAPEPGVEPGPDGLRFPAAAVPLPDGGLLLADTGHDAVVELTADGSVVARTTGFREPNGLCLLPGDVAAEVGYDVVVADTVGHRVAGLNRATGQVRTLAGDGTQQRAGDGTERVSSPWDVAWWQGRVWIAMAGVHQLWTLDPGTGHVEVAAGTGHEGLVDGPAEEAWFAQPSGLAVDGDRLWVVDSETSSLRWVRSGPDGPAVHTAVGTGLFDFGFRDGAAADALLQHPLGLAVLPDGAVAVCDTYNGAVRRHDPATGEVRTLATGLAEPADACVQDGRLVVVESAVHRLTTLPLDGPATTTEGLAHTTHRPVTEVAADLDLVVGFTPPPGQRVDDRLGPATRLVVGSTPPALLRAGDGAGTGLRRTLRLDPAVGDGVLHVAARAATCDSTGGEGAACRMHQQDWGISVRLVPGGTAQLSLPLGGSD